MHQVTDKLQGHWAPLAGIFAFALGSVLLLAWARKWEGRQLSGAGRMDAGRVIGIVGLMGSGKTSFVVTNWIRPALQQGRRVVANFGVKDSGFPGTALVVSPETFAWDLLGTGSSLNVDKDGEPMSGWFVDTACTCGKGHDEGCDRVMPQGEACCRGFERQRQCGCRAAVVVIDESHAFLPANQSKPLPIEILTWLTMARKNHVQIIWCTQYYKWVHSAVRRLSQDVFRCEPGAVDGKHLAMMCRLSANGELSNEVVSVVKFDNRSVRSIYDTFEVIVPAHTAHELAGTLSKKTIGPRPIPASVVPFLRLAEGESA